MSAYWYALTQWAAPRSLPRGPASCPANGIVETNRQSTPRKRSFDSMTYDTATLQDAVSYGYKKYDTMFMSVTWCVGWECSGESFTKVLLSVKGWKMPHLNHSDVEVVKLDSIANQAIGSGISQWSLFCHHKYTCRSLEARGCVLLW